MQMNKNCYLKVASLCIGSTPSSCPTKLVLVCGMDTNNKVLYYLFKRFIQRGCFAKSK